MVDQGIIEGVERKNLYKGKYRGPFKVDGLSYTELCYELLPLSTLFV